jgi:putative endopeptidase
MDEARIEALGFSPIQPDLQKIEALQSKSDLPELLANLHERGIGGFFDASVDADARRSDQYAVSFAQGGLGLPDRDYYFAERFAKERAAYEKHMAKMFALLGDPAEAVSAEVKSVLAIETALAKASRKLEDLADPITNYHKLTLENLEKRNPPFLWTRYLAASHAAKTETAIFGQPEFFQALDAVLKTHPLEELKAYLRWHVLIAAAPLLHQAAVNESFAFFGTILNGQPQIEPRWKRITRRIDEGLGEALGEVYVAHYFPQEARTRAQEMVEDLKAVYHDRLGKVPWMTEATRRQAVAKFEHFTAKIGAPTKFRDYSAIEIKRDDFLGNVQRADAFESRREMARIGQPVDRSEWGMTPPTVNAYFNPTMNEIVFPAGILQPPFFDVQMDDAVNYGAMGATIGHEMTHGYDNSGRKYDGSGNLRDWWTKADVHEFELRTQKLIKQFDAISPLKGLHVNGKLTLAENIADLGGLSIAYEALERNLAAHPEKRQVIDGFTPEQRFFISYAQSWAAKERDEYVRNMLTTDVHAPDMVRGYAPQLNLQEFYDAFGIKKGAPLWRDPEVRAVIW